MLAPANRGSAATVPCSRFHPPASDAFAFLACGSVRVAAYASNAESIGAVARVKEPIPSFPRPPSTYPSFHSAEIQLTLIARVPEPLQYDAADRLLDQNRCRLISFCTFEPVQGRFEDCTSAR